MNVTESTFLLAIAGSELCVNLADVPFSVLNIVLIGRTPLVHFNLKCILLFQSALILLRSTARIVMGSAKLVLADPLSPENLRPWSTLYHFSLFCRNCVVLALIVERIGATVRVKSYESKRSVSFTLGWLAISIAATLFNVTIGNGGVFTVVTSINIVFVALQVLLALVELTVFKRLYLHNARAFRLKLAQEGHSLSERYQIIENIRIGHQLSPMMYMLLSSIVVTALVNYWGYFGLPGYNFLFAAATLSGSIFSLGIELSMILCHPFLRRDLVSLARPLLQFCANRVNPSETGSQQMTQPDPQTAKQLQEEYFAMLKSSWENKC